MGIWKWVRVLHYFLVAYYVHITLSLQAHLFLNCLMNWIHYEMLCNFICETRSWSLSNFRSSTKFFRPSTHISWYWCVTFIMYVTLDIRSLAWKRSSYTGDPTFKLRTQKFVLFHWNVLLKKTSELIIVPERSWTFLVYKCIAHLKNK